MEAATIPTALAIDLPQPGCKHRGVRNRENRRMIRNLAIAALVASVLATPSRPAVAQNTLGGAIVGAIGGRRGAAIGAVIGAGTGAAIASQGEPRRGGYYYYRDGCYWPRPDGSYVPVDPRYCY